MSSRENPTGVWDGSYKGVWHLAEGGGVTEDSTTYNENGIITGTILRPSTGQIGNAYNYGTDGRFNVGDPADGHLDFGTDSFMVSMWINIDTSTGALQLPLYKGASSIFDPGYCFGTPTTGDSLSFHITDGTSNIGSPSASITYDSWIYIIGIVDRTNNLICIYKNGAEVETGTDISTILSIVGDQEFQCANPTYDFDGLLDEVRVLNVTRSKYWIKTEYYNQYNPNSFYSIGQEQGIAGTLYSNLQVNAIDLYGNPLPSANISIYNQTTLIRSNLTDSNGNTLFMNIIQAEYNFTVSIISDIGNYVEIVNITSEPILINQSFQIVNLICNVSSNFFEVIDIDDAIIDSGWIIVGNSTHELQNCSIDSGGHTRFWWVNTLPYQYNYSVYYQDNNYNPIIIKVASGDITTANSSFQVQASLTTVNFIIKSYFSMEPVSGVKLLLTATNTGESIVNLTTDNDGKATLRWLNSSGINGNYSLQLEFFGATRNFNMTGITKTLVTEANFTVSVTEDFYLYIEVSLANYETELISLNPTQYISVQWGSQLKLRTLFNVSRAVGAEYLLGPTYSDIMTYEIFKGAKIVQSGDLDIENDYIGTHYSFINTEELESDVTYLVFITAQKAGYSIPQELLLQLNVLKNDLFLNQSQNDDSIQSVYWSDSIDFSIKSYGESSESFTTEVSIFQNIDHSFRFSLPDIGTNWNLTQITFNIYNISWNVNASDINVSILDPYGVNRIFNISNHVGYDYNLGVWTGITLDIDKESPTSDNNFEFIINGTFDNTIDVIADASFVRNHLSLQYMKFNVSDTISLLSESQGWVIKNITFIIQNCYNTVTWQKVNLSTLTNLNISTAEGFKYSLHSGDENGNGVLIIDDRIIYPLDNQYIFVVESSSNIIFNVIIKVDYIQNFYQNNYLETLNISYIQKNIPNGGNFQLSLEDVEWKEDYAMLLISGINNGSEYLFPSQVGMNITIGGQTFIISNTFPGQGTLSLKGFIKDSLITAVIETNQPVNFTLSFKISYSRKVAYETLGTINYIIRESPEIFGIVNYYPSLGEYFQTIDTSLIDADHYTMRFYVTKENYNFGTKDLDFIVMDRLTLMNGESTIAKVIEFMYIKDEVNFTFLYTDTFTGARIIELKTQYYMWEKYDIYGNVTANGEGALIQKDDGSHVLDFNSEIRTVGEYLLIVTLEKDNYEYKNAMIRFTIKIRELEYSLGNNFKNYQINVAQGNMVPIQISLTDPTKGGIPLLNASVRLIISGNEYQFTESVNGSYILNFPTSSINAFFTSTTLGGIINITKEDYFSEEFFITVIVGMEEIFPGMPTFYFLIIIFSALAVIGSIVGYRVYKHATIPTFVKNIRQMEKEIKGRKSISESLLYQTKEIFVGERVRDKWSSIGLSLGDILGIEIKKSKKLSKVKPKRKTETTHDQKPLGILVMKWDERVGTELLIKYPEEISIDDKALMQVYSTHEYSGEKGIINLSFGLMNILSYYTGQELSYYIVLFLTLDDDPDLYEGAMPNVAQAILQNLDDDAYLQMIPSLFQRLSVYPSLTNEQNLIFCYHDEIKRMIINILRNYGVITKSELNIWVKDRDLEGIINLEAVLADLIKWEIIKVASVKGIPSELIFLTNDIFMLRVPPDTLFRNPVNYGLPAQLTKFYQDEVQKFFNQYRPTEEDTLDLLNILIDPEVYETVRLLRTAIVTMKDFEKLKNKGVSDIYSVLQKLWDTNTIKVFKDENELEYYTLLSDFHIDFLFPKYQLNIIKTANDQKSKSDKVLLQYLNLLEETYFTMKSNK
ncbi:MAG: LamG-like jellyroll fold domain-containing protein [Promethearchaeota archaeon]